MLNIGNENNLDGIFKMISEREKLIAFVKENYTRENTMEVHYLMSEKEGEIYDNGFYNGVNHAINKIKEILNIE